MNVEFEVLKDNCKNTAVRLNPSEVGKITRMLAKYIQKANDLGLYVNLKKDENNPTSTLILESPCHYEIMQTVSMIKNCNTRSISDE